MKIQMTKTIGRNWTDIHAWSSENDRCWMFLRFDPQAHTLTGVFGEPSTGGLSMARPVRMASDRITAEALDAFTRLGWASAAGLRLTMRTERQKSKQELTASAFADFLAKSNRRQAAPVTDDGHPDIEISADDLTHISGTMTSVRGATDTWMPRRRGFVDVGKAMSGFDALPLQARMARHQPGLTPPAIDVDAARSALASIGRPSAHAVHYYGTTDVEQTVQTYRRQAAASYPLLAGIIAENPKIALAVDAGEPIQPLLMERTGLDKASLKRVSGLRTPLKPGALFTDRRDMHGVDALGIDRQRSIMTSAALDLDEALRTLSAMPPDRTPRDDAEWIAFSDIMAGCAVPLRNAYGIEATTILEAAKGNWVKYRETLAKAADFDVAAFDRATIALTSVDAMEVIDKFSRTAILPMLLAAIDDAGVELPPVTSEFILQSESAAFRIITGRAKNVAGEIFESARRYAGRVNAIMEAMNVAVDTDRTLETALARIGRMTEQEFPVFAEDFTASNGLVVAPFRHFDDFVQESRRLGHCVGQSDYYTRKARRGDSILFSVQTPDRQTSFSTAELTGPDGDTVAEILANVRLLQHQGPVSDGRAVRADAELAFQEWFAALKANRLDHHAMEVKAWKEAIALTANPAQPEARRPIVTWSSVLEIDREDPEIRAAVFAEWKTVIGGQIGKMEDPGAMFRFPEVRDLLSAMSPETATILTERAAAERAAREAAARLEAEADGPGM